MSRWEDAGNAVNLHRHHYTTHRGRVQRLASIMRGEHGEMSVDTPRNRSSLLTGIIPFFGATRREENHARWEDSDPEGSIHAKARMAQDIARRRGGGYKKQKRWQRNNRREY
jgi:hypothetical protein